MNLNNIDLLLLLVHTFLSQGGQSRIDYLFLLVSEVVSEEVVYHQCYRQGVP